MRERNMETEEVDVGLVQIDGVVGGDGRDGSTQVPSP